MTTSLPVTSGAVKKQRRVREFFGNSRLYGIIAALIILVIFNIIRIYYTTSHTESFVEKGIVQQEYFKSLNQALNVNLTQVATIVIVGVGMTIVIATGGIDLSVGASMAIAGQIAAMTFMGPLAARFGIGMANVLAIILALIVAAMVGVFNGFMITRLRFQPIIATLVVYIGGRGVAQVLTNGYLLYFKNPGFQYIALGRPLAIPTQVYIMFAVVIAAAWLMRKTSFGQYVLAIGGNERAARLAGVPVNRVKTLVYMICAFLSGIAGLIFVAINSASDANLNGFGMELDAIAATAVGGTQFSGGVASIFGTFLGALFIQLVRFSLISIGVPYEFALVVNAIIILTAVYFQRQKSS
jgi:ribose/xylose/arabinose/galactoside ABC-type transport system permease subunit